MKNRSWIPSLALALGLFPMVAMAAPGDHLWSRGLGVNGRSATVDAAGNVYVAGTFSGTVDFGGGGVTAGGSDFFCVKYDPDGNLLWTRTVTPDAFLAVTAISAQPSGGVYVAGNIPKGGTVDFGGGPLGAPGVFGTAWIVQYDASGNHVFSDDYGTGSINDLDASNSEVAIAAQNSASLDFGGGPLGTSGDRQAIVAKLASGGAHVWSSAFGDASTQSGQDVGLMSGGEVVLLAAVRGTINFGAGSHTADANDDIAIAKFDGSGGAQWSNLYQGQFSQFGSLIYSALDVSDVGAIAITGEFANTVDFGGGALTATITDTFVARFAADGSHQWSGSYGSTAADGGTAIWIGPNGNLFLAGTYRDTISFGGPSLALIGGSDMYVAEISANGAHLWSKGLGSTGFEYSPSVEADAQGNAAISVQGSGVDLGGGLLAGGFAFGMLGESTPPTEAPVLAGDATGLRLDVWPNPSAGATTVGFSAPVRGRASLDVFDAAGRRVRSYSNLAPESAQLTWDARDAAGTAVAPGVYFVRLATESGTATRRVTLVR